jgi:glutathione peroxidase
MSSIYELSVKSIAGEPVSLEQYRGQVLLIVNTASACGFTPQYEGLEALYRQFKTRGFTVLGFPCNQFGAQEPGSNDEIANFCSTRFDLTFPLFAKIDVNGSDADPLYQHLKAAAPGILGSELIKWNFTKFLVNQQGEVIDRFASTTKPQELAVHIEKCLTGQA